jgi:hypothetical protein
MLRKHQYRKMVDQAFSNKELLEKKPNVIVAVLDQIRLSGNLQIAFSGRQGRGLGLILKFIARNLFYPAYFDILYDIINVIIGKYNSNIVLILFFSHVCGRDVESRRVWNCCLFEEPDQCRAFM